MSSLKLKHSGGNSVSLNPPSSAPTSSDVAFKLPNADGNANEALVTDASGQFSFKEFGSFKSYAILLERQGDTDMGTFTSGAFRTRPINVELADPDGIVTLSNNQFTLQAGTYIIKWSCVAFDVDHHSSRIGHISGSFTTGGTEMGTSHYSDDGDEITNTSMGVSLQVPTNANVYEIQHECTSTQSGNGFGVRTYIGENTVSSIVEIIKIV